MRNTLFTILISAAVLVAVACGTKKPKPAEPGHDAVTATGSGSDTTAGSAAGSDTAGSGTAAGSESAAGSDTAAGSGSATAGSGSGGGSGSDVAEGDDNPFKKLTHEEQLKIMKTKVLPAMTKAFKEFDKKDFAKFGCKTCHGKGVASGKYEMPNPNLPKLDFEAIKAGKQHPKTVEFMEKVVKPGMAEILGMKESGPDNPKGFGCLHCHTMKK